jgi:endonuclease/exonuclease/phosphatase family metal-dependent hydrolase
MDTIRIASWNIAGGYPIASLAGFDYEKEDISYFTSQLAAIDPDIVCLQESHTSLDGSRVIAAEIAQQLGLLHVFNSPASPSHVNKEYQLSTAILSRWKFISQKLYWYPDPDFDLFFPDGRKAVTHQKNLQLVQINDFYVANTQMLPLTLFGYAYDDGGDGSELAAGIDQVMSKVQNPVIWCGDFNYNHPLSIYDSLQALAVSEALPDKITRPHNSGMKLTPDHIFYTSDFRLVESDVKQTKSDHYLCYAELQQP